MTSHANAHIHPNVFGISSSQVANSIIGKASQPVDMTRQPVTPVPPQDRGGVQGDSLKTSNALRHTKLLGPDGFPAQTLKLSYQR